jgi:ParB family chromosome partitioning protein
MAQKRTDDDEVRFRPDKPKPTLLYVKDIIVPKRARKDMGDLDALAESIRTLGMLHAIPVAEDELPGGKRQYTLLAGERRLEAVKLLGQDYVKVHVVADLDEWGEQDPLGREADENTCRKPLLPSEAVALAPRTSTFGGGAVQCRRPEAGVAISRQEGRHRGEP